MLIAQIEPEIWQASKPEATPQASVLFTTRSVLPAQANHLWQIKSGFVRSTTWLEEGTTVVLGIWGPGETVGILQADDQPAGQLECMTEVEATPVLITSLPQYQTVLLEQLNQLQSLMQIRSYKRVDLMLLKFLGWLSDRFGKDTPQGRIIDLRLTHFDIAESIGTTRVTVTRILNQFEQQGVIKYLPLKRIVLCEADLWHYDI